MVFGKIARLHAHVVARLATGPYSSRFGLSAFSSHRELQKALFFDRQSVDTGSVRSLPSSPPFRVNRTSSDRLPVYVNRYRGGSMEVTVLRKIRGDSEALQRELEFLCQARVT